MNSFLQWPPSVSISDLFPMRFCFAGSRCLIDFSLRNMGASGGRQRNLGDCWFDDPCFYWIFLGGLKFQKYCRGHLGYRYVCIYPVYIFYSILFYSILFYSTNKLQNTTQVWNRNHDLHWRTSSPPPKPFVPGGGAQHPDARRRAWWRSWISTTRKQLDGRTWSYMHGWTIIHSQSLISLNVLSLHVLESPLMRKPHISIILCKPYIYIYIHFSLDDIFHLRTSNLGNDTPTIPTAKTPTRTLMQDKLPFPHHFWAPIFWWA